VENVVIWVVGAVVLALVLFSAERRRTRPRRKREAALRRVADRLGFVYEPHGDPFKQEPFLEDGMRRTSVPLANAFHGYPHFLRGQGASGPVAIFDVWYEMPGGGKPQPSDPYKVTLAAFRLEGAGLPDFHIAPEGRADRFSDKLRQPLSDTLLKNWRDIDFEGHPAFSDRYTLRSNDEGATRSLFTPAFIAFWDSLPEESRLSAAASGGSLVVFRDPPWKAGRQGALPPEAYESFIAEAERVVEAFVSS
jgi:hypothetical protein